MPASLTILAVPPDPRSLTPLAWRPFASSSKPDLLYTDKIAVGCEAIAVSRMWGERKKAKIFQSPRRAAAEKRFLAAAEVNVDSTHKDPLDSNDDPTGLTSKPLVSISSLSSMGPFGKSLMSALYRSVDLAKNSAATALRMEVEPSAASLAALPIWSIARQADIIEFATGSDSDLGGLSTSRLDWTPGNTAGRVDETRERAGLTPEGHGRFWGTLSNQVPRGCRVDRTGYAGMRNRVSSIALKSKGVQ